MCSGRTSFGVQGARQIGHSGRTVETHCIKQFQQRTCPQDDGAAGCLRSVRQIVHSIVVSLSPFFVSFSFESPAGWLPNTMSSFLRSSALVSWALSVSSILFRRADERASRNFAILSVNQLDVPFTSDMDACKRIINAIIRLVLGRSNIIVRGCMVFVLSTDCSRLGSIPKSRCTTVGYFPVNKKCARFKRTIQNAIEYNFPLFSLSFSFSLLVC